MAAMDSCNNRWGRGTVVLAAAGFQKSRTRSTKFEKRSPRYTNSVAELSIVG